MRFEPDAVREALRELAARPGRSDGEHDDGADSVSAVARLLPACLQTGAPPLVQRIGADDLLITLAEASRRLPRIDGRKIAVATIWRWCRRGLRGVRLEYVRLGRKICTSHEALVRFFSALTSLDEQTAQLHRPPLHPKRRPITSKQRLRAVADADAVLQRAGI